MLRHSVGRLLRGNLQVSSCTSRICLEAPLRQPGLAHSRVLTYPHFLSFALGGFCHERLNQFLVTPLGLLLTFRTQQSIARFNEAVTNWGKISSVCRSLSRALFYHDARVPRASRPGVRKRCLTRVPVECLLRFLVLRTMSAIAYCFAACTWTGLPGHCLQSMRRRTTSLRSTSACSQKCCGNTWRTDAQSSSTLGATTSASQWRCLIVCILASPACVSWSCRSEAAN